MPIDQIDDLVHDAIARRIFPGAIVLVAHGATLLHVAAYGSTMYADAGSVPVNLDTHYDIASLTKVFTATAVLQLVDAGLLQLDEPAARYLPRLQTRDVTIRHLLSHTSGLAVRLSVLREAGREGILDAVYATVPATVPGQHVAYTNVNSLLLGEVIATLRGEPLDTLMQQHLFEPLGMKQTGFLPPANLQATIAPTEWDDEWRGGLVHGSVHDESAYALGGVAGHAGLFSTVADLHRFCLAWMRGGTPILNSAITHQAITNQTPGLTLACGLGWMLDRPAFMGAASPGSYGHTGFTGPAVLVAPQSDICVIFLTNRTYPRRSVPTHHAVIASITTAALSHELTLRN